MTRLLLTAALLALFASPLAAQSRSASIRVSATIAEPMRMPEAPSVTVDYREGRYLEVTASGAASAAVPYLTQVVAAAGPGTDGSTAAGDEGGRTKSGPAGRVLPSREGEARYRLDLGGRTPAPGGGVRVTYVIASNL